MAINNISYCAFDAVTGDEIGKYVSFLSELTVYCASVTGRPLDIICKKNAIVSLYPDPLYCCMT